MSSSAGPSMDTDPVALAQLVGHYYLTRWIAVSALAWVMHDYFLTLGQEIQFVWCRNWGVSKLLFLWTRYAGMTILICYVLSMLEPSLPQIFCEMSFVTGAWGGVVTQTTLSVIMILRLWAMYGGNKKLLSVLIILFTMHFIVLCAIFGSAFNDSPPFFAPLAYYTLGLNACFPPAPMPPSLVGVWISRLILDSTFFGLAVFKAYQQVRAGWNSSIIDLLIRDNVMAFGLVCFWQVSNLFITAFGASQTTEMGVPFALATDVIIGARLLLHTRQVLYKRAMGGGYDQDDGLPLSRVEFKASPVDTHGEALSVMDNQALVSQADNAAWLDDIENGVPERLASRPASRPVSRPVSTAWRDRAEDGDPRVDEPGCSAWHGNVEDDERVEELEELEELDSRGSAWYEPEDAVPALQGGVNGAVEDDSARTVHV